MNYKTYIFAFMLIVTVYALSGINYNGLFKGKHVLEARVFVMLIAMSISYLASMYIISFIEG